MKTYCFRIRQLRKKAGLTQKQLGALIGYSNTAISDWEMGLKQPGADAIILLSRTFGESADYLLGLEDEDGHKEQTPDGGTEERNRRAPSDET